MSYSVAILVGVVLVLAGAFCFASDFGIGRLRSWRSEQPGGRSRGRCRSPNLHPFRETPRCVRYVAATFASTPAAGPRTRRPIRGSRNSFQVNRARSSRRSSLRSVTPPTTPPDPHASGSDWRAIGQMPSVGGP